MLCTSLQKTTVANQPQLSRCRHVSRATLSSAIVIILLPRSYRHASRAARRGSRGAVRVVLDTMLRDAVEYLYLAAKQPLLSRCLRVSTCRAVRRAVVELAVFVAPEITLDWLFHSYRKARRPRYTACCPGSTAQAGEQALQR